MANGNGVNPEEKEGDEVFELTIKRHQALFLIEAVSAHQRLIKYCLMRIAEIDFIEDKFLEERLDKNTEKYYYNLDLYLRDLKKDLDKILYPYNY